MLKYVRKHSTQSWANQFLRDIKIDHNKLESSLFLGLMPDTFHHRLIHESTIKELDKKILLESYSASSNRLIIIDTMGIISPRDYGDFVEYELTTSELSDNMIGMLDSLSRIKDNKLWLISPEGKEMIAQQLKSIEKSTGGNALNTILSSK